MASLRLASERRMMTELLADPEIAGRAKEALSCAETDANRRRLLARGLRVTERIIPSLVQAVNLAQRIAHLGERPLEIYVYESPVQNACCMDMGEGRVTCAFSSSMVERLTLRELLSVIGHEMGHVLFRHMELPAAAILQKSQGLPSGLAMKLMSWSRHAEISADRLGLACCQDLRAATTALIKISCGLREPMLQFNAEDYLAQMKDIQTLSDTVEDAEDWFSTHPFNPLRVAALNHLWESQLLSGLIGQGPGTLRTEELDARIEALLSAMEPGTVEAKESSARECVLWGGYWVSAGDGKITAEECRAIRGLTDEKTAQAAEAELRGAQDLLPLIKKKFADAARRCRKLSSADRHALVQKLIVVARADSRVADGEKAVLREICSALKVNPSFVETILRMTE